jgi:ankyrin repeat protein
MTSSHLQDDLTALHVAVEHGRPLVVQALLGFGAKVEYKGGKVRHELSVILM